MILRRITEHVKTQNWTAVGLDFVIVVVGVFIGLQVSNWNDVRGTRAAERAYLVELRTEVSANNMVVEDIRELSTITITAGESALGFLEDDTPCAQDCWRLLVDFFHASQVAVAPISLSVFEEMQRQGLPHSGPVKIAMKIYHVGTGSRATIFQRLPEYREHVRGLIPLKAQRALWQDCHSNYNGRERYITDCPAGVSEAEASAILETIRAHPDMHRHLTYWIGLIVLDLGSTENQIEMGNSVIAAIDQELRTR